MKFVLDLLIGDRTATHTVIQLMLSNCYRIVQSKLREANGLNGGTELGEVTVGGISSANQPYCIDSYSLCRFEVLDNVSR